MCCALDRSVGSSLQPLRPMRFDDDPSYRDRSYEERECDECQHLYRGPAAFCSMRCALLANMDDLTKSFTKGQCPRCGCTKFHRGRKAEGLHSVSISVVCEGCKTRFNVSYFQGSIIGAEPTELYDHGAYDQPDDTVQVPQHS